MSTIPKNIDYDVLATHLDNEIIPVFQDASVLSLFVNKPIPDGIANEAWAKKVMKNSRRAAWTSSGYAPSHMAIDFTGFKLTIDTFSEDMVLSEKDLAFYQKEGLFDISLADLGKNLAWTVNKAFFTGKDAAEGTPHAGQYNYVMDEGTGNGTALRPLMAANNGTAGTWKTYGNVEKDIAALIKGMQAKNYNPQSTYVFIPKVAAPALALFITSSTPTLTIEQYVESLCAGIIWTGDDFLPTDNAGTPTAPALSDFDIFAIDIAQVVIGIARAERIRTIGPHDTVRDTTVEAEIWPCPYFIPQPIEKTVNGTTTQYYYKGVGMVDGCNWT